MAPTFRRGVEAGEGWLFPVRPNESGGLYSILQRPLLDPAVDSPLLEFLASAAQTIRVAAAWLVSFALPERFWRPLTRTIACVLVWIRPGWKHAELAELNRRLGTVDAQAGVAVLEARIALGHESRLHGLREYRPGVREHPIQLVGVENVHDGLAAGRGVILWVASFVFGSLLTKIALQRVGFEVSHLSRPSHGFSGSRFGVRWLNPIWTKVEERFVHERIVMDPGRPIGALRVLRKRLADNQVVSITVGTEGVRTVTVPFLAADLRVATGPITLAANTRASLIPVFTVRDPEGCFTVELQPPLDVPAEGDRDQRDRVVAQRLAQRLAPFATEYAGQWLG